VDVCNKLDFAFIEKRGLYFFLELSDNKNNDTGIDNVTSYFTGGDSKSISLESHISRWLMVNGIEM
jgi:hypothetical protein